MGGHLPQARGGGDIGLYRFIRGSFVAHLWPADGSFLPHWGSVGGTFPIRLASFMTHLWPADGSFRGLHRSGDAQ